MPEMHARFTYIACEPFTKNKEKFKISNKQVIQDMSFKTNQAKFVFSMIQLEEVSDKVLCDKAFIIAENLEYDGYHDEISKMIYKFFDKTSAGTSTQTGTGINFENQQLGVELNKPIIRKFLKNVKYIYPLRTTFGVLIQHICN